MADDRPGTPANGPRIQPSPEAGVASRPARGPVVVVDGDRPECSRACRILGDAGFDVIGAADGRAALRQVFATSETPSLLLCAIELPGMSGIELAARLCAARPGVPVILTSPDPATVERARQHTPLVRAVLLKPYTADALRIATAEALGPEA
jgi:CheY-like chemotaxis protein